MVKEDRVKQLYKIALYEQNEEKEHCQAGQFYQADYIWKEVMKSFFTGSFAYVILMTLCIIGNWPFTIEQIQKIEVEILWGVSLAFYLVFMVVYLFLTVLLYRRRYHDSREKLDAYLKELEAADAMYEREEKLKV